MPNREPSFQPGGNGMHQHVPKVSIVLSVRNGMPYLPECIDSLQAQTVTDWELIVNDNCSQDGSADFIAARAALDSRITLLRGLADFGAAGGRNRAIEVAKAPWIAIMDADDRALPRRLERQLWFAGRHPGLVAMSCLAYYINAAGQRAACTNHDLTSPEAYEGYMARGEPIGLPHSGALMRRDVFQDIGGFRPQYEPAEDIDMWNRVSERGLVLIQSEYLFEYRVHATSVVATRFDATHMKFLWVEASMQARRSGETEPSWQQFQCRLGTQPVHVRFNRWREMTGRRLYREAGSLRINGHFAPAVPRFAAAVALRPSYALSRLKSQQLRNVDPGQKVSAIAAHAMTAVVSTEPDIAAHAVMAAVLLGA